MENENMISVPYGDFVAGVKAMANLASIRAILTNGDGYCSDSINAVLGIEVKQGVGNARTN